MLKKTSLVLLKQSWEQSTPHPTILESPRATSLVTGGIGIQLLPDLLWLTKKIQLRCVHLVAFHAVSVIAAFSQIQ